jgi:hypothetical protein
MMPALIGATSVAPFQFSRLTIRDRLTLLWRLPVKTD